MILPKVKIAVYATFINTSNIITNEFYFPSCSLNLWYLDISGNSEVWIGIDDSSTTSILESDHSLILHYKEKTLSFRISSKQQPILWKGEVLKLYSPYGNVYLKMIQ